MTTYDHNRLEDVPDEDYLAAKCIFQFFFKKREKVFDGIRKLLSLPSQKRHTLSGKRSKDKNRKVSDLERNKTVQKVLTKVISI